MPQLRPIEIKQAIPDAGMAGMMYLLSVHGVEEPVIFNVTYCRIGYLSNLWLDEMLNWAYQQGKDQGVKVGRQERERELRSEGARYVAKGSKREHAPVPQVRENRDSQEPPTAGEV